MNYIYSGDFWIGFECAPKYLFTLHIPFRNGVMVIDESKWVLSNDLYMERYDPKRLEEYEVMFSRPDKFRQRTDIIKNEQTGK